ncbi:DNA excision repair protein ERCC-3 [Candidatus Methanophagaceae archaeon]|nr:DNA excision repair protein ERCC-3 [Methanophagales archaeon]
MTAQDYDPLIVQGDKTILLEVDNPRYEDARDAIIRFAELIKSPEHVHTYKITNLSLWNAAAAGMRASQIISALASFSRYEVPENVITDITDYISRYGRLKLEKLNDAVVLRSDDAILMQEVIRNKKIMCYLTEEQIDAKTVIVKLGARGYIKKALTDIGFPAEDLVGYVKGELLPVQLLSTTKRGSPFSLRKYQIEAVDSFYAGGSAAGGSGVVVLPCGAGKTVVGMGVMAKLETNTLIITTSTVASRQWRTELLDKTNLEEDEIGEYGAERKEIKPITIATYQILTYRPRKSEEEDNFPHFHLFDERNWGLIIYDEVHLLPAPVFRVTAELQAMRRLGLTATLVREDGRERDVFSLIGPKKYDALWKELEQQGWIAEAVCNEIRLKMDDEHRLQYALAPDRNKYRIAAENPQKYVTARQIVEYHRKQGDRILVIGTYLDQLERMAEMLNAKLLTGKTPNRERMQLYDDFRSGEEDVMVVSKVANFAVDLPDANVAVQISGTFGSRQEEAQRLGRLLRPKSDGAQAFFYTLVSKDTKDQDFAAKRQLFLTEQGYRYVIKDDFCECSA